MEREWNYQKKLGVEVRRKEMRPHVSGFGAILNDMQGILHFVWTMQTKRVGVKKNERCIINCI